MEICRACLLTEQDMIALDDFCVISFNLLTNLKISLGDEMPQYFCNNCFNTVKIFIDFREKAILSDATLRDITENTKPILYEDDNVGAGSSIKTENDYDAGDVTDCEDKNEFDNKDKKRSPKKGNVVKAAVDKTSLQCVLCKKKFVDSVQLLEHLKEHKRGAKCKLCLKKVLLADLYTHTLVHLAEMLPSEYGIDQQKVKLEIPDECESGRFLDAVDCDDGVFDGYQDTAEAEKEERNTTGTNCKKKSKEWEQYLHHCGVCKMKFDCKELLVPHLERHKYAGTSSCQLCAESFAEWPQLFAHRWAHLPRAQRRCHICDRHCFSESHMESHYRLAHYDGEDKSLKCKHCPRSFATSRKLSKHTHYVHGERRFICDHCNKGYTTKSRLRVHMVSHGGPRRFVCDLCGFRCRLRNGLAAHKLRHIPNKIRCKVCERLFLDQAKADEHKLTCKPKIMICPECGKAFNKTSGLTRHLQSHRAQPAHGCPRCPALFRCRANLKAHVDRHDGNRTQRCEFCSARFYSANVLVKHRRVHTGEKPYVCKVCHKGFTGNHNLKVHMRVHGEDLVVKRDKPQPQPALPPTTSTNA